MKKLLAVLALVVVLIGAVAVYLVVTTPSAGGTLRFPLGAQQRALLADVPDSAESFVLVPAAATAEAKLRRNPVTRGFAERFADSGSLPRLWVIGGADLLAWRSGKETTYRLRLDPLRSILARTILAFTGDERSSHVLLEAPDEPRIPGQELDRILELTRQLPAGDALVVQREGARGSFPPIARPAVSSIAVSPTAIDIVSRAVPTPDRDAKPVIEKPALVARFARGAMISASFAEPPRLAGDMNRLVGTHISNLLGDGGAVVIYSIDAGKLLPRPHEVVIVPSTAERRAELTRLTTETLPRGVTEAVGFRIETAESGNDLLIAFDGDSIGHYRSDAFDTARLPANLWSIRIDPQLAAPVFERLAANPALRYLAPHIYRAVRDTSGWMEQLEPAGSVEAGLTRTPSDEELRVRIGSK